MNNPDAVDPIDPIDPIDSSCLFTPPQQRPVPHQVTQSQSYMQDTVAFDDDNEVGGIEEYFYSPSVATPLTLIPTPSSSSLYINETVPW
jgi:hypothetical protein